MFRKNEDDAFVKSVLSNYDKYLSTNTFLMAYSHFEEYLYLLWKDKAGAIDRGRGFSIDRYETILIKIGVRSDNPSWVYIKKATMIRHCLLHANGRLSFMVKPSPDDITRIVQEFPDELFIRHDRLYIDVGFVGRFVDEVRKFRSAISLTENS
jgi:hypothetical protein